MAGATSDVSHVTHPPEYSFAFEDPRWVDHLETEGFCVVRAIATADETLRALELFWDELCVRSKGRVVRSDQKTWLRQNGWPGGGRGFTVEQGGGCHYAAAWALRGLSSLRACFARVWSTPELLVSFDTFIAWRPWWEPGAPREFIPVVEGLHMDQNPTVKRGRQAVQGMIPLLPVTPATGGLAVVPRTHLQDAQDRIAADHPQWASDPSDWCVVTKLNSVLRWAGRPMLVEAGPGDLILWDSRLLHQGLVGAGESPAPPPISRSDEALSSKAGADASESVEAPPPPPQLARLALTVCMTPRDRATPEALEARRSLLTAGTGLTHWPHETRHAGPAGPRHWLPPALTPAQMQLVG